MIQDQLIELNLTIAEVNFVLKALAKLPYEQVALLIPRIQEQAQKQLQSEDTPEWHQTTT